MLRNLQTSFMKGVYNKSYTDNACAFIKETNNQTPEQILSIYRGSIYGGLKKALAETYSVTKNLVGSDFFNEMIGQYITQYPCQVQDLNDYGEALADFIADLKQARSVPYLADIARLEWFYNIALNSAVQKNNLIELKNLTVEQQVQINFQLVNAATLMSSVYPIDVIWGMQQDNTGSELNIDENKAFIILWKNKGDVEINRLTEEQFYFLELINKGLSFIDICTEVSECYPDTDVNILLCESIEKGWVRSFFF